MFKKALEDRDPRYEYSVFKIQQILAEIDNLVSPKQLCDMYWRRMVKIMKDMKATKRTDNLLWNCIDILNNKCEIKDQWRKWLIKKDDYTSIKDAVIRELNL